MGSQKRGKARYLRWRAGEDRFRPAQVLGINIPTSLLWIEAGTKEFGCVQKEPPHFTQTLGLFLKAFETNRQDGEPLLVNIANSYQQMNVFFDVWVCNRDRFANCNNVLLSESKSALLVWLIDYNSSLGQVDRPWSINHEETHGINEGEPPIPMPIWKAKDWSRALGRNADNLERRLLDVSDSTIEDVCARAFEFYAPAQDGSELAKLVSSLLIKRKFRVKEWVLQLVA